MAVLWDRGRKWTMRMNNMAQPWDLCELNVEISLVIPATLAKLAKISLSRHIKMALVPIV